MLSRGWRTKGIDPLPTTAATEQMIRIVKAENKKAVADLVDVEKPAGLADGVVGSDRYRNERRKPRHSADLQHLEKQRAAGSRQYRCHGLKPVAVGNKSS